VTIATSAAVLLWRTFRSQGRFLGRVKVHSVLGDHVIDGQTKGSGLNNITGRDPDSSVRNIFLPLEKEDGANPAVEVEKPYPGIFIFRFTEGFNYPNASHYLDHYFVRRIFSETKRTNANNYPRLGVSFLSLIFPTS
jgi:sodium-independent sulfate anion transporter 11